MRTSKRWLTLLRVASRITSKEKKEPSDVYSPLGSFVLFRNIDTGKSCTWSFRRIPTYTL